MEKRFLTSIVFLLLSVGVAIGQQTQAYAPSEIPTFTDAELLSRIRSIQNKVIPPRFDKTVKSYINTYTVRKRDKTERMLGKLDVYFPMFERHLLERDMPIDLKYLPVVESALNPRAISRSGAAGLWQFMPPTGREYGLKINSLVDERKDPTKSTKAALTYLSRLYNKYGDWSLVLAAYNGGPGRVNRAIKRGRSKNFWRIRRYLPAETRAYVPAFIAASYIVQFHHHHNLQPILMDAEMQMTETTKVYQRISFQTISEITGTDMKMLADLNPSYKQRFLPTSRKGNYLTLPAHRMAALMNYLGRPDERLNRIAAQGIFKPSDILYNNNFNRSTYIVRGGETVAALAEKFNCTENDIRNWNKLEQDQLPRGRRLIFYIPKVSAVDLLPVPLPDNIPLAVASKGANKYELPANQKQYREENKKSKGRYRLPKGKKKDKYIYHQLRRKESLKDVADQYPNISLDDLLEFNQISIGQQLKPGSRIIVGEKK
ncbi:MAG: transglycosylase SLT domain-containing protein [Bacteroidota bacterium]